jgi:hypothetical protein
MTYRERRERRAERLRGWAEKRETQANTTLDTIHRRYAGDHGFNFQPGHIPERTRVIARQDRAFESLAKAEGMTSRAAGIEAQLERAIYRDDDDAEAALLARIQTLSAERERIRAYNASCRKGARDVALLDDKQRRDLEVTARVAAYSLGKNGEMPGYALTNLSANIRRQADRLEALIRQGEAE